MVRFFKVFYTAEGIEQPAGTDCVSHCIDRKIAPPQVVIYASRQYGDVQADPPCHDPVRLDGFFTEEEGFGTEYPLYADDVFGPGEGEVVVVRQAAEG